jgi:hypothetical protein
MRPWEEREISDQPVQRICSATRIAMTGSITSQPVMVTSSSPTSTPAVVQTSVSRCLASASSVMDRCWRAARSITHAHPAFAIAASTESAATTPSCSSGCGAMSRGIAVQMMAPAATKISAPSMPPEKY